LNLNPVIRTIVPFNPCAGVFIATVLDCAMPHDCQDGWQKKNQISNATLVARQQVD
jgi:hypothetical protein